MRSSPLSPHTAGAYERKTDPRAGWASLEPAPCTHWLSVGGTGRVNSLFGINSYADASVTKLPWMAFRRIPLFSKLCCLESQTCEGGGELPPPFLDTRPRSLGRTHLGIRDMSLCPTSCVTGSTIALPHNGMVGSLLKL